MADKKLYVVKDTHGNYWCGYDAWDKQLRKAKVYTSIKYAQETVDRFKEYNVHIVEIKMYEVNASNG
jgi:nitrous oxidase accessory protein NosD